MSMIGPVQSRCGGSNNGSRRFRYFASSPPGRFAATWTLRYLDVSSPVRFATSLDVSTPDSKEVLIVSQITNFRTGDETPREVAKRLGIETSKGVKLPSGESSSESSKVVAKRPGGKLAK